MSYLGRKVLIAAIALAAAGSCGGASRLKLYSGPELPRERLATVNVYSANVLSLDGVRVPTCEYCQLELAPGQHRFVVSYRRMAPSESTLQLSDGSQQEQVRSRSSRHLDLLLVAGHEYLLFATMNPALDDWFVELHDDTAGKLIFSDRSQHCGNCPPA